MESIIKKITTAEDFEDAMEPLFLMGRFIGTAPFNLVRNNKRIKLKTNLVSVTVAILLLAAYSYFIVCATMRGEPINPNLGQTSFLSIIEICRLFITYLFVVVMFANIFLKKSVYELIMISLKEVDVMTRYLEAQREYTALRKYHIIVSIIFEFLRLLYFSLTMISIYKWTSAWIVESLILFYVPGFAISGTLIVFCCLTNIIHQYLKLVKEQLIELFNKTSVNRIISHIKGWAVDYSQYTHDKMKKTDTLERLHLIFKTYDKICSCASIMNKCFSWNMIGILGVSYASMIFNQFYVIVSSIYMAKGAQDMSQISFIIYSFVQLSTNVIVIAIIIKYCSRCEDETNEIKKILSKMMIDETDEEISTKLHQITSYLVMRYPKFSASDLFYIDTTLSFSMMGSATIYLIILVQLTIDTKYNKH